MTDVADAVWAEGHPYMTQHCGVLLYDPETKRARLFTRREWRRENMQRRRHKYVNGRLLPMRKRSGANARKRRTREWWMSREYLP